MNTATGKAKITCPPSAVVDQILPWSDIEAGNLVLFEGGLHLLVKAHMGATFGRVRLVRGGETQDAHVTPGALTAVRRYMEG
jgi:hypothetical protein